MNLKLCLAPLACVVLACLAGCRAAPPAIDETGADRSSRTAAEVDSSADEPVTGSSAVDRTRLAFVVMDLEGGAPVDEANPELLDTPVSPGSIAKIPSLLAAFEAGVVTSDTRIACDGTWTRGAQRYVCSHPPLRRPLSAVDALAHSCNVFFATVSERVPRAMLDRAFLRLGFGRPAATATNAEVALGLAGIQASPRSLLGALLGALATPADLGAWVPPAVSTLRAGLSEAARSGTAAALSRSGVDALAKTGTAPMPGGGFEGLVVAAWPVSEPVFGAVAVAPGAAGMDATDALAEVIRAAGTGAPPTLAIGRLGRSGRAGDAGRTEIQHVAVEDYVADVVTGEAVPQSSTTALEALAIVVRTYAERNRGRHRAEGYDLCDLTHCQVRGRATAAARAAARATAGLVLLDRGGPAEVFYTASCGGRSASSEEVWPGLRRPYFEVRDDPFCVEVEPWTSTIEARRLVVALNAAGWRGASIRDLVVMAHTPSGRVQRLSVPGLEPPTIDGEGFRLAIGRSLGWNLVKSSAFEVERVAAGYRLIGRGAGHGVGLCVLGSSRMAATGATRAEILSTYLPGLEVGPLPAPGTSSGAERPADGWLRLVLPSVDGGRHDEIARLVARHADDLRRRLGAEPLSTLEVRFHPTVEAYQRETGRAWWTAAATSGHRIELVPLSALDRRGTLEPTIRHELVHVLTEAALAKRPLWVREGVATYFAGGTSDGSGSSPCPDDREFGNADSAEALGSVYRRAAACVAGALRNGAAWRNLGLEQGR